MKVCHIQGQKQAGKLGFKTQCLALYPHFFSLVFTECFLCVGYCGEGFSVIYIYFLVIYKIGIKVYASQCFQEQ